MPIEKDISVRDGLTLDVHLPEGEVRTVVVLVSGYRDEGFRKVFGCSFKDLPSNVAWCERFVRAGVAAVVYANSDPAADAFAAIDDVRARWPSAGVALWASSGNVPVALWVLMQRRDIARAALLYGYTLDVDDAANQFRFANPASERSVGDISPDTEMLFVRAGADVMPGLNGAADRFISAALAENLPIRVVNLPNAAHAFDVNDPSHAAIDVVVGFVAQRA